MADQGSQAAMQTDIDAKCTTNGANENTGSRIRQLFTNLIDTLYAGLGFTSDERAAIEGSNSPSASNVFATEADIPSVPVASVNAKTGAVVLEALDIDNRPFFEMFCGIGAGTYRDNGVTNGGRPVYEKVGGDPATDTIKWNGSFWITRDTASPRIDKFVFAGGTDDVANPTLVSPSAWIDQTAGAVAGPLPTFTDLSASEVQVELERINAVVGRPPLEYLAKCTQTGTDAPIAAIIKNTLGVVPVWGYSGDGGTYIATSAGAFPAAKTEVVLSSATADGDTVLFYGEAVAIDSVRVVNATGVDESTFTIHISVYP